MDRRCRKVGAEQQGVDRLACARRCEPRLRAEILNESERWASVTGPGQSTGRGGGRPLMGGPSRRPVVVGVDDGDESRAAVVYGTWEADRRGAPLRIVSAVNVIPEAEASDDALLRSAPFEWKIAAQALAECRELAFAQASRISVETSVVVGQPADVLVRDSESACLVVIGTRSASGVLGHLSGSIAAQVIAHAHAPVTVMSPRSLASGDPGRFMGMPVVVGVDGSVGSYHAIAYAAEQAVARHAVLHGVFAWTNFAVDDVGSLRPDSFRLRDEESKAGRLLAEAMTGLIERYPGLDIRRSTIHTPSPSTALNHVAADRGLIVVGAGGAEGRPGLRVGEVGDRLIRSASVPVAIVRSGR